MRLADALIAVVVGAFFLALFAGVPYWLTRDRAPSGGFELTTDRTVERCLALRDETASRVLAAYVSTLSPGQRLNEKGRKLAARDALDVAHVLTWETGRCDGIAE